MINLHQYKQEQKSVNPIRTSVLSLILIIPGFFIFGVPYSLIWGFENLAQKVLSSLSLSFGTDVFDFILDLALLGLGSIIHVFIHGIVWAYFAKDKFKSIKFGVFWRMLSPYCFCIEPLKLNNYRLGIILPTLIVSILPGVISIWLQNPDLLIFSAFMLILSSSDFYLLYLLKGVRKDALVLGMPIETGCYIFTPFTANRK